jgi:hypothetical protein
MKITVATLLINCLTFGLLVSFYYSPVRAEGNYKIPHTQVTVHFGQPAPDYSKFIIPATALSPVRGKK